MLSFHVHNSRQIRWNSRGIILSRSGFIAVLLDADDKPVEIGYWSKAAFNAMRGPAYVLLDLFLDLTEEDDVMTKDFC